MKTRFQRQLQKYWLSVFGLFIVLVMSLLALLAPFVAPHNPNEINLSQSFEGSTAQHLLGNDQNGSDVLSKLIFGARTSMLVGLSTVILCMCLGLIVGMLSGYFGGIFDHVLMRIADVFLAFPGILLVMGIAALLEPSIINVIFALSIVGWVSYARIVRAKVLTLKSLEYIQASQLMGARKRRILFIHILPNLIGPLSVMATFGMAGAIIAEASLSFLGIGVPPTESSWGTMLDIGRQHLIDAPSLAIYPGLAIMLSVMAFNFLGDGLRDIFDPKA